MPIPFIFILLGAAVGGAAVGGAVGAGIGYIVCAIKGDIDSEKIREQTKIKCPDALKALVKSKTTKKVNCGIFDEEKEITEIDFSTENGVVKNLYVGQEIYI